MGVLALIAAPARPCNVAGNEILNCGFEQADGLNDWPPQAFGICTHDNSEGSSGVGNASCASTVPGMGNSMTLRQCVDNIDFPGSNYDFGFDARVETGSGVTCTMTVDAADDAVGCGGANQGSGMSTHAPTSASYTQSLPGSLDTTASAGSIFINITCNSASPFTIHVDDVFLGVNLTPVDLLGFSVD